MNDSYERIRDGEAYLYHQIEEREQIAKKLASRDKRIASGKERLKRLRAESRREIITVPVEESDGRCGSVTGPVVWFESPEEKTWWTDRNYATGCETRTADPTNEADVAKDGDQ